MGRDGSAGHCDGSATNGLGHQLLFDSDTVVTVPQLWLGSVVEMMLVGLRYPLYQSIFVGFYSGLAYLHENEALRLHHWVPVDATCG